MNRNENTETWGEALEGIWASITGVFWRQDPREEIEATEAPSLNSFGNPISKLILIGIIGLMLGGVYLTLMDNIIMSVIGVISFILGLVILRAGLTELSPDPRTAGLLTVWDKPIAIEKGGWVVGGDTVIANYFPFYVNVIPIDITNDDKDFDMKILSFDDVQMEGKISLTLQPDTRDLPDYIQAGKMKNIFKQLDDIIYRETQKICREKKWRWREIAQHGDEIADLLRKRVFVKRGEVPNGLETHFFGVKVKKLQVRLLPPPGIIENAEQRADELLQRKGEKAEYQTTLESARIRLKAYRADPEMEGKNVTLQDCINEIRQERQIRQNQAFRIDTSGNKGGPVSFVGATFNVGNNKDDKKRKENKS